MALPRDEFDEPELTVLVTGANSGLGHAICCRLIDEFLHARPQSQKLNLIVTTRNQAKSDYTVKSLIKHLFKSAKDQNASIPGIQRLLEQRVNLIPENLDLSSLRSVRSLARKLNRERKRIDVLILNAGIAGVTGLNWPLAIWSVITDLHHALTWPTFKIGSVGWLAKPQLTEAEQASVSEPPLGDVFCANVFGHYLLCHELLPSMQKSSSPRTIWISSTEAYKRSLNLDDLQAIRSDLSYESSKRLTDLLILTSELDSSAPFVNQFWSSKEDFTPGQEPPEPTMYVCHPGICATAIVPLHWTLHILMLLVTYVCRWTGSMWHTCDPYKGATAAVWLALARSSLLNDLEDSEGKAKWGSAVDTAGQERVERTEVEGWGYGGKVGDAIILREEPIPKAFATEKDVQTIRYTKKGRMRGAKDLTKEDRETFDETGRACWREMERLRKEWESILDHSFAT